MKKLFSVDALLDESAVSAIEYGLIGAFMAVLIASFANEYTNALISGSGAGGPLQVIISTFVYIVSDDVLRQIGTTLF